MVGASSSSSSSFSAGVGAIPAHIRAILGLGGGPLFGAAAAGAAGGGAAGAGSAAGSAGELVVTPLQFFQDLYPASTFECIRTAPVQYANDARVLWTELTRLADQSRTGTYLQSAMITSGQMPGHWRYIPHLGASSTDLHINTS